MLNSTVSASLRFFIFRVNSRNLATAEAVGAASQMNIGDSDVSPDGTPSQFLIVRNLEPSVTEDLFVKGVSKLLKPGSQEISNAPNASKKGRNKMRSTTGDANLGARDGSLKRILLVRDRLSNDSWRYGFAEFSTIEVGILPTARWDC